MDDSKEKKMIREIEIRIRCLIHGETIENTTAYRPLGHGRAWMDLGRARCKTCGTSHWLTIDINPMSTETVTHEQWLKAFKAALASEMGVADDASEEEEDEAPAPSDVVPYSAPASTGSPRILHGSLALRGPARTDG